MSTEFRTFLPQPEGDGAGGKSNKSARQRRHVAAESDTLADKATVSCLEGDTIGPVSR